MELRVSLSLPYKLFVQFGKGFAVDSIQLRRVPILLFPPLHVPIQFCFFPSS